MKGVQAVLNQARAEGWVNLYTICGGNEVILWVPLKRISKKRF